MVQEFVKVRAENVALKQEVRRLRQDVGNLGDTMQDLSFNINVTHGGRSARAAITPGLPESAPSTAPESSESDQVVESEMTSSGIAAKRLRVSLAPMSSVENQEEPQQQPQLKVTGDGTTPRREKLNGRNNYIGWSKTIQRYFLGQGWAELKEKKVVFKKEYDQAISNELAYSVSVSIQLELEVGWIH